MAYRAPDIMDLRLQNLMGGGGGGYSPEPNYGTSSMGYQPPMQQQPSPTYPSGAVGAQAPVPAGITPPTVQPVGAGLGPTDPSTAVQQMIDAVNKVYTPEYTSRDRFNNLLDTTPVREEPSAMRKIAASALAWGNPQRDPIEMMEKAMYAPHNRAMEDWKARTQPFAQAAQYENTANSTERQLAGNVVNAANVMERTAATERANIEKARIADVRAKAYAWKQMKPDYAWDTKGPTYVLRKDGDVIDTGIKTGELAREDELLIINQGRVDAAREMGSNAFERAQMGGAQLVQDKDGNWYVVNPRSSGQTTPVEGLKGGGLPGRPVSGPSTKTNTLESRRVLNDTLKNAYQLDPANKRWIKKNTNNDTYEFAPRPQIEAPGYIYGKGVTAEDVAQYDDFRKSIDPTYVPPPTVGKKATEGLGPTPEAVNKTIERGSITDDVTPMSQAKKTPAYSAGPGGYSAPQAGVAKRTEDIDLSPPKYKIQYDPNNAKNKRRTLDGKTFEYSTDGGKTWKKG